VEFTYDATRGQLEANLLAAWKKRFHGTFDDNEAEFCRDLVKATRGYMPSISIAGLGGSLHMLSRLDRDDDARALLAEFKQLRGDAIVSFDRADLIEPIQYAPLRAMLAEAEHTAAIDNRAIDEAIKSALDGDLTSRRDRERLAQFSAEEFERYFLSTEQEGLTIALRELGNAANRFANPDEIDRKIQETTRAVAASIAGKSRINRLRMEAMGLVEKDGPA